MRARRSIASALLRPLGLLVAIVLLAGAFSAATAAVPAHATAAKPAKTGKAASGKRVSAAERKRRAAVERKRRAAARKTQRARADRASSKTRPKPAPKPAPAPAPAPTPAPAPAPAPTPAPTPAPAPAPSPDPAPAPDAATLGYGGFGIDHWPGASWRPYSGSSPFNQLVGSAAAHPRSDQMVARVLQWGRPGNLLSGVSNTTSDFAHPVYYSRPTDPVYRLQSTMVGSPIDGMTIPVPTGARAAGGSDGHMTIVTPDGWEYDLWQAGTLPAPGGTLEFSLGGRTRVDGDGLGGKATAAEFGNLAGMIRPEELAAGSIDHALFIVLKCTSNTLDFGYGEQPHRAGDNGSSYVYPAAKGGTRCSGESDTDVPPMGARFQLAMSDDQIAALAVPAWKKTVLRALARYGGFVGDTGGPGFGLMFQSSSTYTSFGRPDPLVDFARANNLPTWEGDYVYNIADGVDWTRYLRVVVPPSA
jgi:hypothetical protein